MKAKTRDNTWKDRELMRGTLRLIFSSSCRCRGRVVNAHGLLEWYMWDFGWLSFLFKHKERSFFPFWKDSILLGFSCF